MKTVVNVKKYLTALKLTLTGTKKPISVALMLAFKSPPYHTTLISGQDLVSQDRYALFEKIMQEKTNKGGLSQYTYYSHGTQYTISGFNNAATFFSTFVFKDWKRLNVKGKKVLDIGGYVGDTAIYFISQGALKVLVYEPFPYSFRVALLNIKQNQLEDRIEIKNCALGGEDTFMIIDPEFVNNNETRAMSQERGVKIPVVTLDTIVKQYSIVDWCLKMNCEGCEYEVFQKATTDTLRRFNEIYMHYHAEPDYLVNKLKSAGFRVKCTDYIHAIRI